GVLAHVRLDGDGAGCHRHGRRRGLCLQRPGRLARPFDRNDGSRQAGIPRLRTGRPLVAGLRRRRHRPARVRRDPRRHESRARDRDRVGLAVRRARRGGPHRDGLRVAPSTRSRVSDRAVVVRAAVVLGLVWLGDALIYVVLPLGTVERLAAFATWVDSGLAVGPLISGVAVARFGLPALYQALAAAIGITLVVHLLATRKRVVVGD